MTFDKWWDDESFMEVQNFKDKDPYEYSFAKAAWEYQQEIIDALEIRILGISTDLKNAHRRIDSYLIQEKNRQDCEG